MFVTPLSEPPAPLCATVLICTFNRGSLLRSTLESLAAMDPIEGSWDVLVVDNNSTDDTEQVVASLARTFPVGLRYLRELRQGKSYALNLGLTAVTARVVAFTDDDVVVSKQWLMEAVKPILADPGLDYTGGPVRPIWGAPPPSWLPKTNSNLWGTIAVLDYGDEPFIYEDRRRIPIGANMAVRRSVFDRVGGFDPALGRKGKSLLGQEQAEFFCRTRAEGVRGMYVPKMELHHHVPRERLTRGYFRRWWFWKGISRARLHRMHPETETGLDLRRVRRISGVPRFAIGEVLGHLRGVWSSGIRRDRLRLMAEEMMLMYSMGYVGESWRGKRGSGRLDSTGLDSELPPRAQPHP